MILPPITLYSSNLSNARAAMLYYLQHDVIATMNIDERCVHFTFRSVEPNPRLTQIVNDLAMGIEFVYQEATYKMHTQYFDI